MKRFNLTILALLFVFASAAQGISGVLKVCTGSTTHLTGSPGGGTWSAIPEIWASTSSDGDVFGMSAGIQTITYTPPGEDPVIVRVTVNPVPAAISGVTLLCEGEITTLTDATPGGNWSSDQPPIASAGVSTGLVSAGLMSGVATITYALAFTGCHVSAAVTVLAGPVEYVVTGSGNICPGSAGISVGLSGSQSGFSYKLQSLGSTVDVMTGSGGPISFPTPVVTPGTYTVLATDPATGCAGTMIGSAVITGTGITVTASPGPIPCFGDHTTIMVTAVGGSGSYGGDFGLHLVTAGTYTYVVTDGTGCSGSATITLTDPPPLVVSATHGTLSCTAATTSVVVNATGGTPSYVPAVPYTVTGVTAGTYTYTVVDANGCSGTNTITIASPVPGLSAAVAVNVSCHGAHDGSITTNVTGGTGSYTYNWSSVPASAIPVSMRHLVNQTGLAPGTYTVTVIDANGCSVTATYIITQPAVISLASSITATTCNSGANGSISVTPAGGTAPYSYLWSNGSTSGSPTMLTAGSYVVVVTDAHGCTKTATYHVSQPPAIAITHAVAPVQCNGGANGSITTTESTNVLTGTPYTYLWSNGSTSNNATGLGMGDYSVTVTNVNGCTKVFGPWHVAQPAPITVTPAITNVTTKHGHNGKIKISPVSGGTGPYSYLWSPAGYPFTYPTLSGLIAGFYTLTVTDHKGCTKTFNFTVTEPSEAENIVAGSGIEFKVYPNPAKNQFNVEIPAEYTEAEIQISDMTGRIMETRKITDNAGQPVQFSLGNAPKGIYFVRMITGEQNFVAKLLAD